MNTMLIIGHPGHEIRCHGWMSRHRPVVHVLTSGGGAPKAGRTESTRKTVEGAGARCGRLFGSFADQEIYAFMLKGEAGPLATWAESIASEIAGCSPTTIITDMVEGYNSSHDLLAYLVDAALTKAAEHGGFRPKVLCQPLMGRPDQAWQGRLKPTDILTLDEDAYAAKLDAAGAYPELKSEVEHALRESGPDAFRTEAYYETPRGETLLTTLPDPKPYYETFGEEQVRRGKYAHVIRHQEHLLPLARAVRRRMGLG